MTEALTPPARGQLARLFVDYNPFYVVSAMSMLFGIFAVNNSLDWSPIPLKNLLTMIFTLNLYEVALITLAVFLLRLGIRRDAMLLLIIEAFFLADVGFLNMEVFTINYRIGLAVNAVVLIAAVIKVAFVLRAAGIPLLDGRFTYILVQLAVLFAVPGFFAIIAQPRNDELPALAVYGGWWLAGLLPVAYLMTVGSFDVFIRPAVGPLIVRRILSRVLLVLPTLSLIAHLCLASWVYKVTFHPSNVAPLLLGLAVALGRFDRSVVTLAFRMRMQLLLPFVALALSAIRFPSTLVFDLGPLHVSPLRIALLAAMAVYLDGLLLHRHIYFAWAASVCFCAAGLGHSVASINRTTLDLMDWWLDSVGKSVPRDTREWGMTSIVASFVLLALGAMVSLLRRQVSQTPERKLPELPPI